MIRFDDVAPRRRPAILVAGGPPEEDEETTLAQVLEIEESVLSFVRAALAAHHPVIVLADPALALLAAVVAGEYAVAARAENPAPPLVDIVQDGDHRDEELAAALEGLPGAQRLFAPDDAARLASDREAIAFMAVGHVPPWQLRTLMGTQLIAGIVERTIPPGSLAELDAGAVRRADIVEHEAEAIAALGDEGRDLALPLPFLMQRFVARWSDGEDERRVRARSLAR